MTFNPNSKQFFSLKTEKKFDLKNQKIKIMTLKLKFWHIFNLKTEMFDLNGPNFKFWTIFLP